MVLSLQDKVHIILCKHKYMMLYMVLGGTESGAELVGLYTSQ